MTRLDIGQTIPETQIIRDMRQTAHDLGIVDLLTTAYRHAPSEELKEALARLGAVGFKLGPHPIPKPAPPSGLPDHRKAYWNQQLGEIVTMLFGDAQTLEIYGQHGKPYPLATPLAKALVTVAHQLKQLKGELCR